MKFQIFDQFDSPISNVQLDQEAAEFWNVCYVKGEPVTPKSNIHIHYIR